MSDHPIGNTHPPESTSVLLGRYLSTQGAVSQALESALSLDEAVPRVLSVMAEAEEWDFGAYWEVDATAGVLRCRDTWHKPDRVWDEMERRAKEITYARGVGLPGLVWESGEARVCGTSVTDSNDLRAPLAPKTEFHELGFPLTAKRQVVGVMTFFAKGARELDSTSVEMFAQIGRQIGSFIQRQRAQDEVRRLNAELERRVMERASQLESANKELEAFSYSIAHDLRAPLRAIDGFSQALMEDYGGLLPAEGSGYVNIIRNEARRMGNLIDDLLTFSRLSRVAIALRSIDTTRLVRSVLNELVSGDPERKVDVRIAELPPCRGDIALLKHAWMNLLSNALKYTRCCEAPVIEVGSLCEQGATVYFVKDNGAGFDMRYAHKLFGVFQRLHRAEDYEGTGVGLAIVQRIVHRHGGRVWAQGAVGQGATFYFTLSQEACP